MSQTTAITGDQLTSALHDLGVRFILGRQTRDESLQKQPTRLIAALAESEEARLRLSLIPLFLEHPEFAVHVGAVAQIINPSARLFLQCYYSAAVWIGQKHQPPRKSLPDLFSGELGLHPTRDPDHNLRTLAKRHGELSHSRVNWLGTYKHAEEVWHKGLEYKKG